MAVNRKGIFAVALRELDRVTKSRSLMLMTVVVPIVLFLLFAWIYENGLVRDIPVAICDLDRSTMSRTVTSMVEGAAALRIEAYYSDPVGVRKAMLAGQVQGAVIIPRNFERDIKHGRQTSVVVYKNSANLIISGLINRDAQTLIKTISAGILLKKLQTSGVDKTAATGIVNPIRLETQSLYNAGYNYQQFLVPGLIAAMLQMLVMMIAAITVNGERAGGGLRELARLTGDSPLRVLLGKALGYLPIHGATVLGIIGIVFPVFGIPVLGFVPFIVLYFMYFIFASFLLGFAVSCFVRDEMMATVVIIFVNTPAFIFSGFTYPLWAMPDIHNVYAQAMPFTHFLTGFVQAYQMNVPVNLLYGSFVALSIFVAVGFLASWIGLARCLRETGRTLK